jgi:ubiquinone/menaquinone biosynthesis C-methylase UbiE
MELSGDIRNLVTQKNEEFHDLFVEHYDSMHQQDIFFAANQQRIAANLRHVAGMSKTGGTLVDMGCGTGNIPRLARSAFNHIIGVDISKASLAKAQQHCDKVIVSDLYDISELPSGSADAATAYSVLHHLFDPKAFLRECYRVLNSGGAIYCDNDPNYLYDRTMKSLEPIKKVVRSFRRYRTSTDTSAPNGEWQALIKENEEAYNLAEFHHHHSTSGYDGFDIREVRKWLVETGFRRIEFHLVRFNFRNEAEPKVWQVSDAPFRRPFYSHFAFFAGK